MGSFYRLHVAIKWDSFKEGNGLIQQDFLGQLHANRLVYDTIKNRLSQRASSSITIGVEGEPILDYMETWQMIGDLIGGL